MIAQLDTDDKKAELYYNGDAWNISIDVKTGYWEVIGPIGSVEFPMIDGLMKQEDIPDLVKWVARGLNSIPNGNGVK